MMLRRLAPFLALLALATPARAEGPADTSGGEGERASTAAPTSSASPTGSTVAVQPSSDAAEAQPGTARPLDMRMLALDLREALSLRRFIETTPLVVGGLTLYFEAEPIAVHQRPETASQLTVAVAHDRVVLIGAF